MAPRVEPSPGTILNDWTGIFDWALRPGAGIDTSTGIGSAFSAMRPNGVDIDAWAAAYSMAGILGTFVTDYNPDNTVVEY